MLGHTKARRTNPGYGYLKVTLRISGNKDASFELPNTPDIKKKLNEFKKMCEEWAKLITPWEDATDWEKIAAESLNRYKKAGIVLRGARYREGISQKKLAAKCGISQENLSRMENGKRKMGEKVAKKIAKVLRISYRLLLLE